MRYVGSAMLWVALAVPFLAHADITGNPRVIDGDTIEIAGERVRLHGIDAPEKAQTCETKKGKPWECGTAATRALLALVARQSLTCKGDSRDKYGRLIAICYVGRADINEQMVLQGWALAYRKYGKDYVRAEYAAKDLSEGIWKGEFVPPWDWRRGKRLSDSRAKSEPAAQCCKKCRKGKACGNSCISRRYTCRKPPGCACNAQ
jgi:endonuclease YncB( thermonuclease family)